MELFDRGFEPLWLFLTGYAIVLLIFLVLTRREQKRNHVSWLGAAVGYCACVLWPLSVAVLFCINAFSRDKAEGEIDS